MMAGRFGLISSNISIVEINLVCNTFVLFFFSQKFIWKINRNYNILLSCYAPRRVLIVQKIIISTYFKAKWNLLHYDIMNKPPRIESFVWLQRLQHYYRINSLYTSSWEHKNGNYSLNATNALIRIVLTNCTLHNNENFALSSSEAKSYWFTIVVRICSTADSGVEFKFSIRSCFNI